MVISDAALVHLAVASCPASEQAPPELAHLPRSHLEHHYWRHKHQLQALRNGYWVLKVDEGRAGQLARRRQQLLLGGRCWSCRCASPLAILPPPNRRVLWLALYGRGCRLRAGHRLLVCYRRRGAGGSNTTLGSVGALTPAIRSCNAASGLALGTGRPGLTARRAWVSCWCCCHRFYVTKLIPKQNERIRVRRQCTGFWFEHHVSTCCFAVAPMGARLCCSLRSLPATQSNRPLLVPSAAPVCCGLFWPPAGVSRLCALAGEHDRSAERSDCAHLSLHWRVECHRRCHGAQPPPLCSRHCAADPCPLPLPGSWCSQAQRVLAATAAGPGRSSGLTSVAPQQRAALSGTAAAQLRAGRVACAAAYGNVDVKGANELMQGEGYVYADVR